MYMCTHYKPLKICVSWKKYKQPTSLVTFAPKSQPAPLGLMAQVSTSSGSDHTRSQNAPLWGISWFRSMVRIWSRVFMSGERPPWTHKICSSISWQKTPRNCKVRTRSIYHECVTKGCKTIQVLCYITLIKECGMFKFEKKNVVCHVKIIWYF